MTNSESSRLIAETLRLDGEATQGPWMHDDEAHYIVGDHGPQVANLDLGKGRSGTRIIDIRGWGVLVNAFGPKEAERIQRANAAIVCHSRTSAPRLARMLQVAINAVVLAEKHLNQLRVGDKMTNALTEIERIAKEE